MKSKKLSKKYRLSLLLISFASLFFLVGCIELWVFAALAGGGVNAVVETARAARAVRPATPDISPVYLPTVDPNSTKLADNNLTIAETINNGGHRYSIAERQVRNKFFGVNLMSRPIFYPYHHGKYINLRKIFSTFKRGAR